MYKLANNLEKVNFVNGLDIGYESSYNLRRHRKSMHREQVRNCLPRFYFFVNMVVNVWNSLPVDVVIARSLNCFKSIIYKCLIENRESCGTHLREKRLQDAFRPFCINS
ncbi:hypothetical protein BpHYR1_013692 [Brachionus plicatilis]|uniref:RNA-directed DNA polymerase from mobile element jockey-like n=1 Tax=Brachionus plicatilis TaxID=10195 RepID=A0A3M7RTG4_BRAPC|nr:hypothetical protein BpHYR1_013692 [Brachionus plicatilis]